MQGKIVEFGTLTAEQKDAAVELFMSGFGRYMTFSRDEELKRKLFLRIFDPMLFKCYVEENQVLGLMGLGTNRKRPINFRQDICREYFGNIRGSAISRQMNAVFQKPVVKLETDLYLDVLVTDSRARKKGVGTVLVNYASGLEGFQVLYTEVFSRNTSAICFYRKNGFVTDKKKKFSLLRLQGSGYPIRMRKNV